jgi:hypothetical protein
MIRHIERVDSKIIFSEDEGGNNSDHPKNPYHILYPVAPSLFCRVRLAHKQAFLQTSRRTQISAPHSPKEHGKHEHAGKYDKAAVHYMLGCRLNDQVG